MTSDVLRRNKDNPDFKLVLLTCSITYLHREAFRSDVLVSFNPPIELTIKDHYHLFSNPSTLPRTNGDTSLSPVRTENGDMSSAQQQEPPVLDGVKQLTQLMYEQIRQSTLDSPDFATTRIANTARRLYAPLGTQITLGDHVHITQRFIDVFAKRQRTLPLINAGTGGPAEALLTPLPTSMLLPDTPVRVSVNTLGVKETGDSAQGKSSAVEGDYFGTPRRRNGEGEGLVTDAEVEQLKMDLHVSADYRIPWPVCPSTGVADIL